VRHRAIRGLAALVVAALGLVVALAGSPHETSVAGKAGQPDFRRLAQGGPASGAAQASGATNAKPQITRGVRVVRGVFNGSVRNLPQVAPSRRAPEIEAPELVSGGPKGSLPGAVAPSKAETTAPSAPAPNPIVTFKGLDFNGFGAGHPPDTVGDVGPNHFVQAVNTSIGIFAKTGGAPLAAFTFDALWSGANTMTACDADNGGDPTVIYDPLADRWIVADFAFTNSNSPPFFECIAVSKTSDPVSGGWFLYAIRTDDTLHPFFADYPKMGIWPDGLYMTANVFQGNNFEEVRVWAFNRSDLEAGVVPPRAVVVDLGTPDFFSLLPSNMRTAVGTPPAGRENLLVSESQTDFAFDVWRFHVDFTGSGSTFSGPTQVSQTDYALAPETVPTPGNALDTLSTQGGERLMMQAQYAKIGGTESVWVNHTVRCCGAGSVTGIQWAQINVTGGTVNTTPVQQQLYPSTSDGLHRWMGSLAVDRNGDLALGYSVANASTNPDIRYAGRLSFDPLNTLPQTEKTMLSGVTRGTQSGSCGGQCHRWGDYSAMTIDPDGCTFWYTQEYYETTGLDWQTRIGSFRFPACLKTDQTITFGPLAAKTVGNPDFTVSATASSNLPVTFSASGNCTITGATIHITGTGSCSVTASQAGNGTFNPARDIVQSFAIKQGQTITFGALPAKTAGDPDFTVSATASSGLPVSFAAGGACTVSGTTVHLTGVGSCTVTASQPGNANFGAAADVAQTFAIAKANQTITFGALVGKTFGAADFAVSATASSGLAVSFAAAGKCTISGATLHITGVGSCTITASQAGNATLNAATDVARSFAIAKAGQTITFAALPNKRLGARSFTVHATASSRLAVSFAANGSCSVNGAKVHLKSAGTCTLTASQSGNANYNAAKRVARVFKVLGPPCSVPSVVGKKPAAAKTSIKNKHCRTGKIGYAYSTKVAKGRVVSQSRRAGRVLAPGAKINIVVSRGRRP
jgi:PASTA domain